MDLVVLLPVPWWVAWPYPHGIDLGEMPAALDQPEHRHMDDQGRVHKLFAPLWHLRAGWRQAPWGCSSNQGKGKEEMFILVMP